MCNKNLLLNQRRKEMITTLQLYSDLIVAYTVQSLMIYKIQLMPTKYKIHIKPFGILFILEAVLLSQSMVKL